MEADSTSSDPIQDDVDVTAEKGTAPCQDFALPTGQKDRSPPPNRNGSVVSGLAGEVEAPSSSSESHGMPSNGRNATDMRSENEMDVASNYEAGTGNRASMQPGDISERDPPCERPSELCEDAREPTTDLLRDTDADKSSNSAQKQQEEEEELYTESIAITTKAAILKKYFGDTRKLGIIQRPHPKRNYGSFKCRECYLSFNYRPTLTFHKHRHSSRKHLYECKDCPYKSSIPGAFTLHELSCHQDHLYKCQVCHTTFLQMSTLCRHKLFCLPQGSTMQQNDPLPKYACKLCSAVFHSLDTMMDHLKSEHKVSNIQSPDASSNSIKDQCYYAIQQHKPLGPDQLRCEQCKQVFPKADPTYSQHLENVERSVAWDSTICCWCGTITRSPCGLECHKRKRHFCCSLCNQRHSNKRALMQHNLRFHGRSPRKPGSKVKRKGSVDQKGKQERQEGNDPLHKYYCLTCKVIFSNRDRLDAHVKLNHHPMNRKASKYWPKEMQHPDAEWRCLLCSTLHETQVDIMKHLRLHHPGEFEHCSRDEIIEQVLPLAKSAEPATGHPYTCNMCDCHVSTSEALHKHKEEFHRIAYNISKNEKASYNRHIYKCSYKCGYTDNTYKNVVEHEHTCVLKKSSSVQQRVVGPAQLLNSEPLHLDSQQSTQPQSSAQAQNDQQPNSCGNESSKLPGPKTENQEAGKPNVTAAQESSKLMQSAPIVESICKKQATKQVIKKSTTLVVKHVEKPNRLPVYNQNDPISSSTDESECSWYDKSSGSEDDKDNLGDSDSLNTLSPVVEIGEEEDSDVQIIPAPSPQSTATPVATIESPVACPPLLQPTVLMRFFQAIDMSDLYRLALQMITGSPQPHTLPMSDPAMTAGKTNHFKYKIPMGYSHDAFKETPLFPSSSEVTKMRSVQTLPHKVLSKHYKRYIPKPVQPILSNMVDLAILNHCRESVVKGVERYVRKQRVDDRKDITLSLSQYIVSQYVKNQERRTTSGSIATILGVDSRGSLDNTVNRVNSTGAGPSTSQHKPSTIHIMVSPTALVRTSTAEVARKPEEKIQKVNHQRPVMQTGASMPSNVVSSMLTRPICNLSPLKSQGALKETPLGNKLQFKTVILAPKHTKVGTSTAANGQTSVVSKTSNSVSEAKLADNEQCSKNTVITNTPPAKLQKSPRVLKPEFPVRRSTRLSGRFSQSPSSLPPDKSRNVISQMTTDSKDPSVSSPKSKNSERIGTNYDEEHNISDSNSECSLKTKQPPKRSKKANCRDDKTENINDKMGNHNNSNSGSPAPSSSSSVQSKSTIFRVLPNSRTDALSSKNTHNQHIRSEALNIGQNLALLIAKNNTSTKTCAKTNFRPILPKTAVQTWVNQDVKVQPGYDMWSSVQNSHVRTIHFKKQAVPVNLRTSNVLVGPFDGVQLQPAGTGCVSRSEEPHQNGGSIQPDLTTLPCEEQALPSSCVTNAGSRQNGHFNISVKHPWKQMITKDDVLAVMVKRNTPNAAPSTTTSPKTSPRPISEITVVMTPEVSKTDVNGRHTSNKKVRRSQNGLCNSTTEGNLAVENIVSTPLHDKQKPNVSTNGEKVQESVHRRSERSLDEPKQPSDRGVSSVSLDSLQDLGKKPTDTTPQIVVKGSPNQEQHPGQMEDLEVSSESGDSSYVDGNEKEEKQRKDRTASIARRRSLRNVDTRKPKAVKVTRATRRGKKNTADHSYTKTTPSKRSSDGKIKKGPAKKTSALGGSKARNDKRPVPDDHSYIGTKRAKSNRSDKPQDKTDHCYYWKTMDGGAQTELAEGHQSVLSNVHEIPPREEKQPDVPTRELDHPYSTSAPRQVLNTIASMDHCYVKITPIDIDRKQDESVEIEKSRHRSEDAARNHSSRGDTRQTGNTPEVKSTAAATTQRSLRSRTCSSGRNTNCHSQSSKN